MLGTLGQYWQVYAVLVGCGEVLFWSGWAAALYYHRAAYRPAHGPGGDQVPEPLPPAPEAATAVLDARHANVMARTAPRNVPPAVLAATRLAALRLLLASLAASGATVGRWAQDRRGVRPWKDATGTFPAIMAELEHEQHGRHAA